MLSSCELERTPHGGYTGEEMAVNPTAFESMITGLYGQMKGMADATHRAGDYPGDNSSKHSSTTDAMADYMTYNHRKISNWRTETIWNNSYKIIAQSSEAIGMVDETDTSNEILHQVGEAYYLRGLSYFFLARIFGMPYYQSPETNMAVPIINGKPEDILGDNIQLKDRDSVKDVYEQVISDLKKADELMAKSGVKKTNIYASKEAAWALLSRVYLYMSGTYANPNNQYSDLAIEYANKVISSNSFSMLSRDDFKKYNTTLPTSNKETIFAVKRSDTDIRNSPGHSDTYGGFYCEVGGSGWNEMYASAKYLDRLRHSGNDAKNVYGPNAADARGSFIHPFYENVSPVDIANGITPAVGTNGQPLKDKFMVITDSYNDAGVLTNFIWQKWDVSGTPGALIATDQNGVDRPLTEVNGRYKVTYSPVNGPGAVEYIGDIDKDIILNGVSLMFSIFKCSMEGGANNLHTHSPVISRLAEMYLNLAEAYVKKGNYSQALEAINVVRNRAVIGNPITLEQITNNGPAVVDNERTLELAWEAHRGFDAFRVGFPMKRRYPGWMYTTANVAHNLITVAPDSDLVVQLIENNTLNAYAPYGGLTQNPGPTIPAGTYEPYTTFIPY